MTDATCASGVELLMDYLEGELPQAEREAIERHVSGCPRCVAFLESYRATPEVVRQATALAMPTDLQESLLEALRRARTSTSS
jgi:anti-sigma factor RsiW